MLSLPHCLFQVFTFGSFPLKTYLPDGDIDVTAFSNSEELKDTWAVMVQDALEHEEKSEKAEFRVREVQYIQAEVCLALLCVWSTTLHTTVLLLYLLLLFIFSLLG